MVTDEELISKARSIVRPKKMKHGFIASDCGCALVTADGNIFLGVSIDTCSGMGFCAEHAAIAAMVTHGEYQIRKIVAVDEKGQILPPCGRCREFMYQIHEKNLDADVFVSNNKTVKLRELLPYRWDEDL